jgi:hypothetical protein
MVPIRCRWHDADVLGVLPARPPKQAAMGFALYGLRLQAEGISPGPIEATVTISDKHVHPVGQLDLDASDAQWMADAINALIAFSFCCYSQFIAVLVKPYCKVVIRPYTC